MKYARYIKMFLINSIVHDLDKLDVLRALMFGIS